MTQAAKVNVPQDTDCIIYHTVGNDARNMEPQECVNKIVEIVNKNKAQNENRKIILSLGIKRKDKDCVKNNI